MLLRRSLRLPDQRILEVLCRMWSAMLRGGRDCIRKLPGETFSKQGLNEHVLVV